MKDFDLIGYGWGVDYQDRGRLALITEYLRICGLLWIRPFASTTLPIMWELVHPTQCW